LSPPLHRVAEYAQGKRFKAVPAFLAFTTEVRSYWPWRDEGPLTYDAIIEYLKMVVASPATFHSEPIPDVQGSKITTLVGRTYGSFMKDTDSDAFVLYYKDFDNFTEHALTEIEKTAEAFKGKPVRFAKIDVEKNSANVPFPPIIGHPSMRFYPKGNQSDGWPFLHLVRTDDMVRFIKRLGSYKYDVDVPKKPLDELKQEVFLFRDLMRLLPDNDVMKMSEYFRKYWLEIEGRPDPQEEL
jgi:hypothetical protein